MARSGFKRAAISFFLLFLLPLSLGLPVFALTEPSYVYDRANLLSPEEEEALNGYAAEMEETYGVSLVVLTEEGIDGADPMLYAADFYDEGGFSTDGAVLFLEMEERDWMFVTSGVCQEAMGDETLEEIARRAVPFFSEGRYGEGFSTALAIAASSHERYLNGENLGENGFSDSYGDGPHYGYGGTAQKRASFGGAAYVILFGVSLAAAYFVCRGFKSQLHTAVPRNTASLYFDRDKTVMTEEKDRFLYSHVTKIAKETTEHHPSGGGGMRSFQSSSGTSHQGGGGKF